MHRKWLYDCVCLLQLSTPASAIINECKALQRLMSALEQSAEITTEKLRTNWTEGETAGRQLLAILWHVVRCSGPKASKYLGADKQVASRQ